MIAVTRLRGEPRAGDGGF